MNTNIKSLIEYIEKGNDMYNIAVFFENDNGNRVEMNFDNNGVANVWYYGKPFDDNFYGCYDSWYEDLKEYDGLMLEGVLYEFQCWIIDL